MWPSIFALAYGVVFYLGERISNIIQRPHSATLIGMTAFLGMTLAVALRRYHFARKGHARICALLPGLIWILWDAANEHNSTFSLTWIEVCLAAVCGMIEEIAFRGCLWEGMKIRNPVLAMSINSLLFGVFHCANLVGENTMLVCTQMVCAVSVGMLFCGITVSCGSFIPAMILHGLLNLFGSFFCAEKLSTLGLISLVVVATYSTLVGIWLTIESTKERESKDEILH